MTIRSSNNITNFDPYFNNSLITIESAWMERLFADDWTVDPAVFDFTGTFRPNEYVKGQLAESWEFPDPSTIVIHLRKGITWQNIAPANGREFIASDVAAHYNRLYDPTTGGFTKGGTFALSSQLKMLISVTATDKYTVIFKWNIPNPEFIYEFVMLSGTSELCIANPEAVALWGDLSDWHHAIGTGPFILTDFVSGSSATLVKNPDYWQYDVRYPQNKLPYINELKVLIIPDDATALAGLRAGKIDDLDGMSFQQAQDIKKTNPEIVQVKVPCSFGLTIDPRNDVKPFNDIKVRQVMQMAIDLPTIAKNYYNDTVDPYPVALTSRYMTGWGLPYSLWPQDLKDQYAYNPTKAKQLLSDAGYPNGFDTDIMVDSAYDMDLLQIVQSYFNAVNIRMTIKTLDLASWVTIVNTSHKHDQISARSTGVMLGKTTEPISQLTKFLSNSTETAIVRDTVYDAFYTKALAVTTVDQVKQIVSDCNKYIAQQHYVISLLQPMYYSLVQPWLKGYNGQSNAISGADGPSLLFFYPARFWIDQKVKNMGY